MRQHNFSKPLILFKNNNLQLNRWCTEAGSGVTLVFNSKAPRIEPTKIDDSNPFWIAFKEAVENDL